MSANTKLATALTFIVRRWPDVSDADKAAFRRISSKPRSILRNPDIEDLVWAERVIAKLNKISDHQTIRQVSAAGMSVRQEAAAKSKHNDGSTFRAGIGS